jgi:hypothetical protein
MIIRTNQKTRGGAALSSVSGLALALGLVGVASLGLSGGVAHGDPTVDAGSVTAVYGNISADQVEQLSTSDHIQSVAASGAPMAIWEALEHGESVECLECIPAVSTLIYSNDAKTREISAWWLRRRILGVWGDGEVYQSTINTLATDASPQRRAYAAAALGEFLQAGGIAPVATALVGDTDEGVRTAAASALGRLNDDGAGALGKAMTDSSVSVKMAALGAAGIVNSFSDSVSVGKLLGDGDAGVRRRAADLLGSLHATASVASLAAIAKSDPDEQVRIAACHSLGEIGDASASSVLQAIAASDTSVLVRDMAQMALLRI